MKSQPVLKAATVLLSLSTFTAFYAAQLSTGFAQGTAFTYQGSLADNGAPASGSYGLRFILYTAEFGGSQLGPTLTNEPVSVANGLFTTTLDFGATPLDGTPRWLEVAVRTNGSVALHTALSPRQALGSAPYAFRAARLTGILPDSQLSANVVRLSGNGTFVGNMVFDPRSGPPFAVGNSDVVTKLNADLLDGFSSSAFWQLGGNAGTTPGTHFLGTTDNQAMELKVNGARVLRIEPTTNGAPNLIGGASVNYVEPGIAGATIGGGGTVNAFGTGLAFSNRISIEYATIGGGYGNIIEGFGRFGVIGGGFSNTITSGNFASVIGGGYRNRLLQATIGGIRANVIGGGVDNLMDGICNNSVIGGGEKNEMYSQSAHAVIAGGARNHMDFSHNAVIGGGETNEIWRSLHATIGGGRGNSITTNSPFAVIVGGDRNRILTNSGFATISGGSNNIAGGAFATVPGGARNDASGDFSFAAGRRARATNDGSFAWADASNFDFPSTANNQFNVRAVGGVRIVTGIDGSGVPDAGVSLLANDTSWNVICDRNAKKNFRPLDGREILDQLAQVPIQRWNYQWEADEAVPHIGPTAQEFKAAFYPGRNDKTISTLEADGVALAAIQGLNQKVEVRSERAEGRTRELEQRLEQKETEITELKHRLETLEQIIHQKTK